MEREGGGRERRGEKGRRRKGREVKNERWRKMEGSDADVDEGGMRMIVCKNFFNKHSADHILIVQIKPLSPIFTVYV